MKPIILLLLISSTFSFGSDILTFAKNIFADEKMATELEYIAKNKGYNVIARQSHAYSSKIPGNSFFVWDRDYQSVNSERRLVIKTDRLTLRIQAQTDQDFVKAFKEYIPSFQLNNEIVNRLHADNAKLECDIKPQENNSNLKCIYYHKSLLSYKTSDACLTKSKLTSALCEGITDVVTPQNEVITSKSRAKIRRNDVIPGIPFGNLRLPYKHSGHVKFSLDYSCQ